MKSPAPPKPRKRRWLWRIGVIFGLLGAAVVAILIPGCAAFGGKPDGARLARMQASPQWQDDRFVNPQPLINHAWIMLKGAFNTSDVASPPEPIPTGTPDVHPDDGPAAPGLRVTWMGHSSTLIELDGARVLTDPIWSERASPLGWVGPKRWYEAPLALADLPRIDAVVVSHDHYDHLDHGTIVALARRHPDTKFVVGLGVGAHLERWGIAADRIVELDWWERTKVGGLEIVSTPARHASGRILIDNDTKLWTGFALLGPQHRVYYSGDTGLFPAMREIGARLGPFDLTLIEAGQYDRGWPDWHIGPEQAVTAHRWVRGKVMLPVHWGLLQLAYHGWTEPIERVIAEAAKTNVAVIAPRPGQTVDLAAVPSTPERWWPTLPWRVAAEAPVVSSQLESVPNAAKTRVD